MKRTNTGLPICFFIVLITTQVQAETKTSVAEKLDACLLHTFKTVNKNTTVKEIEELCKQKIIEAKFAGMKAGALSKRFLKEREAKTNDYVMIPHKMNYILPVSVTNQINKGAYSGAPNFSGNLENQEAKFQLSVKLPLNTGDMFFEGDSLHFGFTLQSWWQVYASDISKPFRETNYQPELFYMTPMNWHPWGGNTGLMIGFEHQSNGRTQILSRSWNRAYINFIFEKDNFVFSLQPWYRIPEDKKTDPSDTDGDDNPDILDFMGNFRLRMVYKFQERYEFSIKGRENFATNKGFLELGVTFPLWGKLKGYAQYSTGYGESLIDYDYNQHRLGIGFALTDIL